jgi:hypothetical protein
MCPFIVVKADLRRQFSEWFFFANWLGFKKEWKRLTVMKKSIKPGKCIFATA